MRHIVLLFFISGLFCSCHQPQSSHDEQPERMEATELTVDLVVEDSIIYAFINDVINAARPDSILSCKKIADKELIGFTYVEIDSSHLDTSFFSKKDIAFIRKQFEVKQYFKLDSQHIPTKTIISSDTLKMFIKKREGSGSFWSSYHRKYGEDGFCSMSMPLFSLDKKTVIFYVSYHCGGMCGYGSTYIYRKRKGKWAVVKELSSWIS